MHRCLAREGSLLRRAADAGSLQDGLLVHDQLVRSGYAFQPHIADSLIGMYAQLGSAQEARSVFDRNPNPTLYSRNLLIKAYGLQGRLHDDAYHVFHTMPARDVVSWTSMICLLAQHGCGIEAVHLYAQMHVEGFHPKKITFVGALNACTSIHSLSHGQAIHVSAMVFGFDRDVVVGTALIKMYGECGKLHLAQNVFGNITACDVISWNAMIGVLVQAGEFSNATHTFIMAPERNAATWNTMICAYLQDGNAKMALDTFHRMLQMGSKPNEITFLGAVNACARLRSLLNGQSIHIFLVKLGLENAELEVALISMYGKCKSIREARSVFDRMQQVNVISWTAIIVAYTENEQGEEALGFFHQMQSKGIQADEVVLFCCLDVCAMLSTLVEGEYINDIVNKLGLEEHEMVRTALIDMYGKCGSLDEARHTFRRSLSANVTMWNALMTAFTHRVYVEEVFGLLYEMWQNSIKPNSITFSCVLTTCSHAGWVDSINQIFLSIFLNYDVVYTDHHFLCMADLLARAGQLKQAENLIQHFPFRHDEGLAWQCLLAACSLHDNFEYAMRVAMCAK
ncbi:hypothetical protein GOP47_0019294 [Adiantum capillus-veneris]|uniref:Pentatricopeptide repeat-containing protein n=1 Tax=Adiantum capillus-veneris TaxID=13818 RepID=A0A9D4ZAI7_ADICA|nr:hypothetical protein GOP47_0019294 [Adiantum capillus-veneris]